jgi:hypothetical protein
VLHGVALTGPGWLLPDREESDSPVSLDAALISPKPRSQAPLPAPTRPRPKRIANQPGSVSENSANPAAAGAELSAIAAPEQHPENTTPADAAPATGDAAPAPNGTPVENQPPESPAAAEPALTPGPARLALPEKGRVRYVISRGTGGFVIGQAIYTWEHDGLAYKMQSVTETTGLVALFKKVRVVQTSQGEITADGLRPHEFRHERVNGVDTARFDWARRVVSYDGREDSVAPDTQDMLSMYCQLVLLVPGGGNLEMPIATGRKLEKYRFERLGEETVVLADRPYRAIHLQTRNGKDSIEAWVAADTYDLPLKIRFTDRNGEIFDQQAQEIEVSATKLHLNLE